RQREQEDRIPRPIVRRAVAERHRDAEIGLEIAAEEQANAPTSRGQRGAVGGTQPVPPDEPAVEKAVELKAGPVFVSEPLVVAQLEGARDAVVAADLGRAIAAPERDAADIEL